MDAHQLQGMPRTGGGYFDGPPHQNQRWARIDASMVIGGVTMYSWTEMTPYLKTLIPMVGGMTAKTLNFIIEPNGQALAIGSFVKIRPAYFDPQYDQLFYAESIPSSTATVALQLGLIGTINTSTVGANSSAILQWAAQNGTGTYFSAGSDAGLGTGPYNNLLVNSAMPTNRGVIASASIAFTYQAAKPGRVDLYLINLRSGINRTLAAAIIDLPSADLANVATLTATGINYQQNAGAEMYALLVNNTAGTLTLQDADANGYGVSGVFCTSISP